MFTPSCLSTFRSVLLAYSSKRIFKEFGSYLSTKYFKGSSGIQNIRGVGGFKLAIEQLLGKAVDPKDNEMKQEFNKDLAAGKQVLHHYMASSYQGWDQGSS